MLGGVGINKLRANQQSVATGLGIIIAAAGARNEHEEKKNPDVPDGKIFHGLAFIITSFKPSHFVVNVNEFIICNGKWSFLDNFAVEQKLF